MKRIARRSMSVVVLALIVAMSLGGSASAARTTVGAISGTVIGFEGKPVSGVEVRILRKLWVGIEGYEWAETQAVVRTGRNGQYKASVPPGAYCVWFTPQDTERYCREAYPDAALPGFCEEVKVVSGRTTPRIDAVLDGSPGALEGRVVDATDGSPLAEVRLMTIYQSRAIIMGGVLGADSSDGEGYFRIAGYKPIPFACLGVWAFDEDGIEPYYLDLMWFPAPEDVLEPGGVSWVDVNMEPAGFVNLTGQVRNADVEPPLPIAGIAVYVATDQGDGSFWGPDEPVTYTDAEGRFEIANLPQGRVRIGVAIDEPSMQSWWWPAADSWWDAGDIWIQRGQLTDVGMFDITGYPVP